MSDVGHLNSHLRVFTEFCHRWWIIFSLSDECCDMVIFFLLKMRHTQQKLVTQLRDCGFLHLYCAVSTVVVVIQ
jgi:hypothetical protein